MFKEIKNVGKFWYAIFLSVLMLISCQSQVEQKLSEKGILDMVDPFIGTGGHGHTFPGATTPFGMVQLSPDTRLTGWDGCSGYHYSDSIIFGFSHTHLSGTGVSDYGDILLMPVNNALEAMNSNLQYEDYLSPFSHENEKAHPGLYSVLLDKPQVQSSLSVTPRCGIHQYEFLAPSAPGIVLDLEHRDEVLSCNIEVVSDRRIEGHRHSSAWAKDQRLFFVIEFSQPFEKHRLHEMNGRDHVFSKGIFTFHEALEKLTVKVAISAVDQEGSRNNFNEEIKDKRFEEIQIEAENSWKNELGKIFAEFRTDAERTIFYTSLYHTMIAPNLYSDVDGRYRDMDQNIYQGDDDNHYTVFSLWDTYRATHPLYTIIDQRRTNAFIKTMLRKYQHGGIMPIWDLSACYTGCMIGYHGVSVISDAYIKGIDEYDENLALIAMQHSANRDHLGLGAYKSNGFISVEDESESVSKTLEYAYDDWCIGQMALKMGDTLTYERFADRSLNYRNLFDSETKFFRPRRHNLWSIPFDPFEVNSNYTEANAWHYAFTAVHDMSGFTGLHGGKAELEKKLDDLFSSTSETTGRDQADITGLIGQYAHGNEPSHHIAYLYNFVDKPWKTQERVDEILKTQYQAKPDGISGNEDCGQMSAWYVFSALGFYPVLPGSDAYILGRPLIESAIINLENGNQFSIKTSNNSSKNKYVQRVSLNGQGYTNSYLLHSDIMTGGEMIIEMGPRPNREWGSNENDVYVSKVIDDHFIMPPYIKSGSLSFSDSNNISLDCNGTFDKIFYSLNAGPFIQFSKPISISKTSEICVYSSRGELHSDTICSQLIKVDGKREITLASAYDPMYSGGAQNALIDGLRGGEDFRSGGWQGFQGVDMEVTIDLGSHKEIREVVCGFLQDENSWIFFPEKVNVLASSDGQEYEQIGEVSSQTSPRAKGVFVENFRIMADKKKVRYIKVRAKSLIDCPDWHKGSAFDGKAWIFADEILIK